MSDLSSDRQRAAVKSWREDSCLDPSFPLALPFGGGRPEFGPSADEYFARKHAVLPRGVSCGGHCPLHPRGYRDDS
jgi:hypothetical protein